MMRGVIRQRPTDPGRTGQAVAVTSRRGMTLTEALVVAGMSVAFLGLVLGALFLGTRSSSATVGADDATRSIMLAIETISHDVRNMVLRDPASDLAIAEDGRRLSLRRPRGRSASFWRVDLEVVTYSLSARTSSSRSRRLLRRDRLGERPVSACQLTDLAVRLIAAPELSPTVSFLQLTVAAPGAGGKIRHASRLLPLPSNPAPRSCAFGGMQS